MGLNKRRVTVGLISTAVVVSMTSVTTWAMAGEKPQAAAAAETVKLVVGHKAGAKPSDSKLASWGALRTASSSGEKLLSEVNATTVQVPKARSSWAIATMRLDPSIAYVEVDQIKKATAVVPNDTYWSEQTEMRQVRVDQVWEQTKGSSAVKVAVIDSGVDPDGDLRGALAPGYNAITGTSRSYDDNGHGTFVASLIAGRGNNNAGIAGVCWSCQIMPIKALDYRGWGSDSDIAEGIIWAVRNKANIINLSLGGSESTKVLQDAVAYANLHSVLVVAAAGNNGAIPGEPQMRFERQYPAAYTDVLAVGASVRGGQGLDSYSSRNKAGDTWVDVTAPGTVVGMTNDEEYLLGSGTSFAAPIVAGMAALIKSKKPNYTGWSLMWAIQRGATFKKVSGVNYGFVDAAVSMTVGVDTAKPTSSGLRPAQNAYVKGVVPVTPLNLKDNLSGIRNVVLYADNVNKGTSRVAPFTVNYNSAGRNGVVRLKMRVYDKAGNFIDLQRAVVADNTAPTVRITKTPANNSKVKGTVKVSYTGSDKYGVKQYQLLLNGKVSQTRSAAGTFSFAASKVPTKFTVQVRAYDKAGNARLSTKYSYKR